MPQIKTGSISAHCGYGIYMNELDLLDSARFVHTVVTSLAAGNPSYIQYLDQVRYLDPDAFAVLVLQQAKNHYNLYQPYLADAEQIALLKDATKPVREAYAEHINFEIDACYAIQASDRQREMKALSNQVKIDEKKASASQLSDLANQEADELINRAATQMEIFEFFGPDYDDGFFPAATTTELDQVLANAVPIYRKNRTAELRRHNTTRHNEMVCRSALRAQYDIDELMTEDEFYTTNCGGFIERPKGFRVLKACRLWKRAEKLHLVSGLLATRVRHLHEERLRYLKHPPKVLHLKEYFQEVDSPV